MSRPRKTRLQLEFPPEYIRAAQRFFGLRSPSAVGEAALLALMAAERTEEAQPGDRVFVDLKTQPLAAIEKALLDGLVVSFAHRGRLATVKPGTLRAGRLLRRLARTSKRRGQASRRVLVCVSGEGTGEFSADDLTIGQLYIAVGAPDDQGLVCIIDDSGEAYLYPAELFRPVEGG